MPKQPTMATMIATVPIRITVPMRFSWCLVWGLMWMVRKPLQSCIGYFHTLYKGWTR